MNNSRLIIRTAIQKANKQFNPSYNMHTEELSGIPSDRDSYDYAGTEPEHVGVDYSNNK